MKASLDKKVLGYALLAGLPAVILALVLVYRSDAIDFSVRATVSALLIGWWLCLASIARSRVVRPLQTMSNLLLALREGDYSFRARGASHEDPLGEALAEINSLSSVLQSQRRGAVEATALLRTVMEEIDVAVFAFDQDGVLRLVNPAGEKLLNQPGNRLLGRPAAALGLADCLEGEANRILSSPTLPSSARWGLRRTLFREEGLPHKLVVIADLSQPLREEQLKAWQGVVRVLGHELNNSLAPIKSIAGSLGSVLRRETRPPDWEGDLRAGLDIIAARAEGLERFLQAYSRLARLPPPSHTPCDLGEVIQRVLVLESRLSVEILGGPPLTVRCDPAQIEQTLINLVKNAVDAALEQRAAGRAEAGVRLGWRLDGPMVEVRIEDDGPGIAQTTNLFVPFFTTKPTGSGIGLVLCRQVAENHGGSLALHNRDGKGGCIATLRLPLL